MTSMEQPSLRSADRSTRSKTERAWQRKTERARSEFIELKYSLLAWEQDRTSLATKDRTGQI
eukprot:CAMPEP_0202094848 /NCGR_PEP_ID=MMETSP0964-20121228/49249_1 /ASSEMBLY_ACC=CAM_ASM_000500 /TAXON_ID=4773 /ORGANISM="Schizochytrium aggregatum, Strain ATCC28209" /LENGTH=61 /DNA_ID=CAMNT_0048663103 /DNA_START=387 /DNA_END=572 /DNA_ORIENTATION=+